VTKSRISIIIMVVAGIGCCFIPVERESSPEWIVRVVNVRGEPVSNAYVKRTWIHLSIEDGSHSDWMNTDIKGYVRFPRRKVKTNIYSSIASPLRKSFTLGFNASFGQLTTLVALKGDFEGFASYEGNGTLQKEITLNPSVGPKVTEK
jgi:hypothetical protein